MRRLDKNHRPPIGSMLVYTNGRGDIMSINNYKGSPSYWYGNGTNSPFTWEQAWEAMHEGSPIILIALFMDGDEP